MNKKSIIHIELSPYKRWLRTVLNNILLLLTCFMICRIAFLLENYNRFSSMSKQDYWMAFIGGIRFDISAICYVNSIFFLFWILALFIDKQWYQFSLRLLFVLINAICLGANLIDSVYFEYIKRRSTASVFREFANDNLSGIIGLEIIRHWYLLLLFLFMVWFLWKFYHNITPFSKKRILWTKILMTLILLLLSVTFVVCGIRGGINPELRPINNKDAKEYIANPMQSALVLNTPFSIFRTLGKQVFPILEYYTEQELYTIYSPIHKAYPQNEAQPNVVIIILESFASEYSALLNPFLDGKGYMPFLDSLMQKSRYYEYSFANGNSSIDGQASILASIPMMIESFFTSHAALNDINGLATELQHCGYNTAFFHGADNGSLSIDGFTHSVGFDKFHGRNEYNNDNDWDHHWGIWDEPFMQYFGKNITQMKEPFCVGIFTLTSHHPFQLPQQYINVFKEGNLEIHKTIRYTDMALKKFFDYAQKQSWYNNTLFVLTGDHTNMTEHPYYRTNLGTYQVPIVFFHPTDTLFQGGKHAGIAQHIDIMPTVLHYTGCKNTYVAFGLDLLETAHKETYAIEYINGIYQIVKSDYILQFDGERSVGFYKFTSDSLLKHNLISEPKYKKTQQELASQLKAIIQSYMERMNENKLSIRNINKDNT